MAQVVASLIADIGANTTGLEQGLARAKGKLTGFGSSMSSLLSSAAFAGAFTAVSSAIKKCIDNYVKYIDTVRDMARAIGTSTEEASRLIQVADDVFLSYDKMSTAMKMAMKQGIDVSIEGLAKLSDAYLRLAPGVERTQFLLKTFGKSGQDMGKMMELGGDAIIKQSAAIEKGLVVTQKAADNAKKYKEQLDRLSDTFTSMTYSVMPPVISGLEKYFAIWEKGIMMMQGMGDVITGKTTLLDFMGDVRAETDDLVNTFKGVTDVTNGAADATGNYGDSVGEIIDPIKAAEKAIKEMSDAHENYISDLMSYADQESGYQEDRLNQEKKIKDIEDELAKARHEGRGRTEILRLEIDKKEAEASLEELDKKWHDTTAKMMFDMIQANFMADGVLSEVETKSLMAYAKREGLLSEAQAAEYEQMAAIANMYTLAVEGSTAWLDENERIKVSLGQVTDSVDTMSAALIAANANAAGVLGALQNTPGFGGNVSLGGATLTPIGGGVRQKVGGGVRSRHAGVQSQDYGGSGMAGTPYLIGTGAQPEMFIPSTSGNFVPNKGFGATYNIVVNNPKKETAENSIRQELKKLSYIGIAV